jgi:hypothetical protein
MSWAKSNWRRSLQIKAERGYVIPAWGEVYLSCAERLKQSILAWHPDADVTIISDTPYGKQSGYANDWQVYHVSPYRQTIKLEADMLCSSPIDHWWTMFEKLDVVISTGARDIYDQSSDCRRYRKLFDDNELPDVYNAVTYWRRSNTAQEFWNCVRTIFQDWSKFRQLLKFPDEEPTTDVVYAMAAVIMGPERVTLPFASYPKIVHMKLGMIPTHSQNWTKEMIWEMVHNNLRLNTVCQWGLVHYHIKDWQP